MHNVFKKTIPELQKSVLYQLSSELDTIKVVTSGADAEAIRQKALLESTVQRMSRHLIDISELYNKITEPYKLWDASLMILAVSQHDDPALIAKLWRSVIYRLVPWQASGRDVQEVLENKRQSNMLLDKRYLLFCYNNIGLINAVAKSKLKSLSRCICGSLI